ncbi:nuclear LIM interactor-interacting factor [Blastocystis sp. subtype 4]|uniref:nuclear LIM interactor-interacting factor n=1 Tax=Blastocystis sp. subtype 4 TaxID=944170 RepID=UPI000711BB9F|nr:nuclear LIM interactor-interacting factor [Blastocystis sp. subtype 4]KNB42451.1 nuclear LIM interactor-interacting factor [Blastocystis sp. subtype 4]|eukprot:XP_014525894.1 nuclear LIM interactor-interacting factor [Blastocystis sp. subtype 4]
MDGKKYRVYANIRPFLFYLLKRIHPYYEIIIFTASQQCYADRILDILDSESHYISHRLYRDDCLYVNNNYIKDLNVLNRDLVGSEIAVEISFGYHIENGIPIISWFDDKSDHEVILVLSCHF